MTSMLIAFVVLSRPQASPPAVAPASANPAERAAGRIDAQVDRRVELLTLVARLAGFEEFNMPVSKSPYAKAADAWFREHRDHAAVKRLRALRQSGGVSFDAIASLAVHLEDSVDLGERIPFDTPPERLDSRWGIEGARKFLAELRDFVKVADTEGFFDSQEERFTEAGARLRTILEQSQTLPWFDRFFGARSGARYCAIPGMFCGGGNYGVGIRFPDGRDEEILPVFGCSKFDGEGIPVFGAEMSGLLVHELCHSYTNAYVDRIAEELRPAAERLLASAADAMRQQAYSSWRTVAYETLVRASVIRCRTVVEGPAAGAAQSAEETARGFKWVPALAADLGRFESDRRTWPTFADFLPEIVEGFAREADRCAAEAARAPKLLSISPANGAVDVDPALAALVLRFDRPMAASWSVVGIPADTPSGSGTPALDATATELTIPVKLEAKHAYHFWLNRDSHTGFKSRDGVALAPVEVTFTTR